jgi:hypothetical protein
VAEGNEYYDVLGLAGEAKFEAIPSPVFATMSGLSNQGYFEEIRSFLGSWFDIVQRSRDEWNCLSDDAPQQ